MMDSQVVLDIWKLRPILEEEWFAMVGFGLVWFSMATAMYWGMEGGGLLDCFFIS